MPNTFITPSVIASRGLATLYNTIVLAGLVSRDYDDDFNGKVGDTVTVRKPAVFTAEEFDRSTGVTIQDASEDSIDITLDIIANVSFLVTDEQMTLDINNFQEQLLSPAMEAIAQKVDQDLAELAADTANGGGGGGVVTVGVNPANYGYRHARRVLTRNNLPLTQRVAAVSPEAVTSLLGDDLLVTANQSGSTDALREAQVGRIYGIESYETQTLGYGPGDRGQTDAVAFHRAALILASRPLALPRGVGDGQAARNSHKGLSLRVVFSYNHKYKQDEVSVDMLYGLKAARPQGVVEIDFGQGS